MTLQTPQTSDAAASVSVKAASGQQTTASRLRDEVSEMAREVRMLKLGSNLTSFAAPASLLLPFSTLELVVFGSSFAARQFGKAVMHADAAMRMLHMLAGQVTASSQTLTAAMMKPYNPIIGEVLTAQSESVAAGSSSEGSSSGNSSYSCSNWRIIAEQVSHHPPITAVAVQGQTDGGGLFFNVSDTACTPLFYGNYVKVAVSSNSTIQLTLPSGGILEEYVITSFPSLYLRGILGMGPQFCEWGGKLQIECAATGLVGSVDFKTTGIFGSGTRHQVSGSVDVAHNSSKNLRLYSISGAWNSRVVATRKGSTEEVELLGPPDREAEQPTERQDLPAVLPYTMPGYSLSWPRHSRQVWKDLSEALASKDWARARAAKSQVEDGRRAEAAQMKRAGETWSPAFFNEPASVGKADKQGIWTVREGAFDLAFNAEGPVPCRNL